MLDANIPIIVLYNMQVIVETSSLYRKYYLTYQCLPLENFPSKNYGVGRTGYSQHALFKACITKRIEQIKLVSRLIEFLDSHPILTHMCGFEMCSFPDES